MLNWLNNLVGKASGSGGDAAVSEWKNRLDSQLKAIDKLPAGKGRPGLRQDLIGYVIAGEPMSALAELAKYPGVGEAIGWTGYNRDEQRSKVLYENFDALPAPIGVRWGLALDAISAAIRTNWLILVLPNGVHWPEALMMHSAGRGPNIWSSDSPVPVGLTMEGMERLLVESGMEANALLVSGFATPVKSGYAAEQRLMMLTLLKGYADALDRHAETIRPLLAVTQVDQRLHMLAMLAKGHDATLQRFSSELVAEAVSNSKQARSAAELLVRRCGTSAVPPLRQQAESGKPEQRVNALRLLWVLGNEQDDDALRVWVRETAARDKAPNAQALIQEWDALGSASDEAEVKYEYPVPSVRWAETLTPPLSRAIDEFVRGFNAHVEKSNQQRREHHERMKAAGHKYALHQDTTFSGGESKALKEYIASDLRVWPKPERNRSAWQHTTDALQKLASAEGVTPMAIYKLLSFLGLAHDNDGSLGYLACSAFNTMHRASGRPSLLELSVMQEEAGHPQEALLGNYCHAYGGAIARDWHSDAVWPYFAQHLDLLVRTLLQSGTKNWHFDRTALFRAVGTLPVPPPSVVNALFDLALGTSKSERPHAQAALANLPGKEMRIINALADGKSEVRTVAAQWIHRLRHEPAIAALEAAVEKEKHDVPKGAMLDALQALGQPVEKYLDRAALAKEATKGLSKELPKDLEWFPWSALPAVRWSDTQQPVPSEVVRWLLVQAFKQKSPEPNAVLRKYCAMFELRDQEVLGQYVLEVWLREDVRPIPPDEAHTRAAQHAQATHGSIQQYPQYHQNSPWLGKSVAELTASFLPSFLRQPAGSAVDSKGLLAIASACAAERAAPLVARYLKEWYGTRASQGKALIAMLAWIEHPTATQLMLSVGSRFRTKSFQDEATRQAEALAERKNWTLSELADRTIPSAGFDEAGELDLSYGERSFTAKLLPDFKIELFNPDGKKIASLPEPRQDDDAERAKEAKKAFSGAKKELKGIVEQQTDRLYEALCTGRDWSFEDWNRYLNQHPVVRRLVQRLVWVQGANGEVSGVFRPLDDGTLTDVEDNEIQLSPDARVRLAHDSILSAEAVSRWQQHLVDYQVAPLFQQLGKGSYSLPAEKAREVAVKDFEGYVIEAFALRGRALKLGYTRGPAEDGGWFMVYEKRFASLGLEAIIEFTGNPLPEENRLVALISLSFANAADRAHGRTAIALADVPKVLLSECYNDLRLIAGEGTGYDADWQKKTQY